jgi:TPR repeat protein
MIRILATALLALFLTTLASQDVNADNHSAVFTLCNQLAEHPSDANKKTEGVDWKNLDVEKALPACRSALEADPANPKIQYQLGRLLYRAENYADAESWSRKAAEQGYSQAQASIGTMYREGDGVEQDDVQAVAWYRKAAEQGSARGQALLGWMYGRGRGVEQDDVQAVSWYRKAAEQGSAIAQFSLGFMYAEGRGVEKDCVQAVAWYRKAAEQGDASSQNNLGVMYQFGQCAEQDDVQAIAWYRKAAEQGEAWGQTNLGVMYEAGDGVEQDDVQAVAWYRKAAEQGHVHALHKLFDRSEASAVDALRIYLKDPSVEVVEEKLSELNTTLRDIVSLHILQIEAGDLAMPAEGAADAQFDLGNRILAGEEYIEADKAEGRAWIFAAANQGHVEAQLASAKFYDEGLAVPQNYQEAIMWLGKAARGGSAKAQRLLGDYFEKGKGAEVDLVTAHFWLNLAASQGDESAQKARKSIEEKMAPRLINKAQKCASSDPPSYECEMSWFERIRQQVESVF